MGFFKSKITAFRCVLLKQCNNPKELLRTVNLMMVKIIHNLISALHGLLGLLN